MKVVFLTNVVTPYRKPVFDRLASIEGWDFSVGINAASEFDRSWNVNHEGLNVVESKTISIPRKVVSTEPVRFEQVITLHLPVGLWRDLRTIKPDVIITQELGPRSMIATAYAKRYGVPLVAWAYHSRISATQGARRRGPIWRWILRNADAVVGMGIQAREVLGNLGVEADRIVDAPNSANTDILSQRLADPTLDERTAAVKAQFDDGRKLALVVGRLVPLKGTSAMLDAWKKLPEQVRDEWRLVFVGEGPLDTLIDQESCDDIHMTGAMQPEEIIPWFRASDLHIFPTLGDVWGLVVNEASCCGTPSLCSVHAGCSDDMIDDGVDGMLFDPTDPETMARDLAAALQRNDLDAMGRRAFETGKAFNLDRLTDGFVQAVARATGKTVAKPALRKAA